MSRRIRTTRPELLELASFAALSDGAARLMLSLPTLCDDTGRCPATPGFIAGSVFFATPRSPGNIGRWLAEIERAGLIHRFITPLGSFLMIVGWGDRDHPNYQYIKKPQPSRYPAPNTIHGGTQETTRETTPETTDLDLRSGKGEGEEAHQPRSTALNQPLPSRPPEDHEHEEARRRGALAERRWRELSDARRRVAAELGMPLPIALATITPFSEPQSFRDLRERLREEGRDAERVSGAILNHLVDQAIETNSLEWLSEKAFKQGSWRTARNAITEADGDAGDVISLAAARERRPAVSADPVLGKNALAIFGGEEGMQELLREIAEQEGKA